MVTPNPFPVFPTLMNGATAHLVKMFCFAWQNLGSSHSLTPVSIQLSCQFTSLNIFYIVNNQLKYFLYLSNSFYLYCPGSLIHLFLLPTDTNWDLLCVMLSTWDMVASKIDLVSFPYQACSLGGERNIKQILTQPNR